MGGRVPRFVRAWPVVIGVALGVSLLLPAAPAVAHNSLTGSNPRDGARVATAPARVELRFLATLDPATVEVTVTGPDNVPAAGGDAVVSGKTARVPLRAGKAGLYVVGYRVGSTDGHPVTGEVRFTLTTGTAADPSATPGSTPTGSTATGTATPGAPTAVAPPTVGSPTADPVPAAGEGGGGRGWLWALVAGLVALAALGGGLLLRRRRR